MANETLLELALPGVVKVKSGKVRELFDLGDVLLMVATDRISAFDCVMPNGIPHKGEILTKLSHFWFDRMEAVVANHRLANAEEPLPLPAALADREPELRPRSMVVKKTTPLPIECVVRGYLAGSGWQEYSRDGTVCGISLPAGLRESDRLPEPIFTPATKAESGHDINISFEEAARLVGEEVAGRVRKLSIEIYNRARDYAVDHGIIIADTKFEFGFDDTGLLLLIDELLTPDSSRFWPADLYEPGKSQPSFDKQFVRDYLDSLAWDKQPPAPALPADVVARTESKYHEAFEKLTGKSGLGG